ncbi:glycosyltransferase family 39 protein [Limnoraphis robusta]|uniref:Glycosyltransferase family 39 protein n=1 Tax=Limnoraphis robusta CCNP1315 TaxID=3110306 RepID=A0ABU5U6M7_9CYAN|nr:glycosyltransferase family 39 protein [Limnoraphis robusta]MEA5522700.1 glycosyltransferase family 39 protein [Limnoraphis robusta CCNP1315]MEA5543842.1 glycosyltransferase family 39 protein [Limnoraphis robusta CCNP1324]
MFSRYKLFTGTRHRYLVILLVISILIGVVFRFIELDRKVFWHDEVYTNFRVSGLTLTKVYPEFFDNQIVAAPSLLNYQRIQPNTNFIDTINSLIIDDPQHPPLYFLMARGWMSIFGSSITASRFLPALLSLLALPFMYGLALELFGSHFTALLATAFLSLSPIDIIHAQTARQYGLLTVFIIASNYLLLKSIRSSGWLFWGLYSLACTLGLYTHPFFGLTIIAQFAYIFLLVSSSRLKKDSLYLLLKLFSALVVAVILFSPWIHVIVSNFQRAIDTTNWTQASLSLLDLIKYWILGFTSLFIDIDFGFNNPWTYLLRLPFLTLILIGLYQVCERTPALTRQFILTSIFVPFLILVLPDLLMGGQRSSVTRYLVSCFPGIQLAVTYLFAVHINSGRFSWVDGVGLWRGMLALCLTASIISASLSAYSETWWSKSLSYWNPEIARQINLPNFPYVVTDQGDNYINFGETISLSYLLDKDVKFILMSQQPQLSLIPKYKRVFILRPSTSLRKTLEQKGYQLELIFEPGDLWKLRP